MSAKCRWKSESNSLEMIFLTLKKIQIPTMFWCPFVNCHTNATVRAIQGLAGLLSLTPVLGAYRKKHRSRCTCGVSSKAQNRHNTIQIQLMQY
jgi:hypothetical protein